MSFQLFKNLGQWLRGENALSPTITAELATGSVSTDNSTVALLGPAATFTGTGEQNLLPHVGVFSFADVAGTLYFDFSVDGTNWHAYPVAGFTCSAGIPEFHTAVKLGRYFRVRYVNGAGGQATFRLSTYFGDNFVPSVAPLNQSLSPDSDATLVRSVAIGAEPDGTLTNTKTDGLGFQTATPLTNGEVYSSGVLDLRNYTQVETHVLSDKNGTIDISFIRDSAGTDVLRTLQIPYVGGSGFKTFAAPAFTPYVKYEFTCDEAGQADFYYDTKFLTKSLSAQVLGVDDFIAPSMVTNLGRNIIVGQDGGGTFKNVTTVETTNDLGTYTSLQVVNGARPSELYGRTAVRVVSDSVTADGTQYTVTADKTLYVTDIIMSIEATTTSQVDIEDGTAGGGTLLMPLRIPNSSGQSSAVTVVAHSFTEPVPFTTGIYFDITTAGTVTISSLIVGYEE